MKLKQNVKTILLFTLLLLCNKGQAQSTDTTKSTLHLSGSISANNNGFSFVPTFSLGKPAVQTGFNISGNKERFSFHPQFWYSMLDYKPWSFIFIWRYKLVKKEKFEFVLGTHAPAINFKSATVSEDGVVKDVIKARRFYPAVEIIPVYHFKKDVSLSIYYLFGTGIETEVSSKNHFISIRPDFNNIPLTKQTYLRLNPQFYYLRIGDLDGFYTAAGLTLAHRKFPLSVGTMTNIKLKSEIETKDFEWNVSLTYAFGKNFVER
ncbi:MAG: hypothetical protein HY842_16960 [Bacteroidetes bacterium]|nr:hypothetical protein [Bacteroidota bacterium]